ncbi:MAG: hypothetical protein WDW38_006158 [Sanguina aurantia]
MSIYPAASPVEGVEKGDVLLRLVKGTSISASVSQQRARTDSSSAAMQSYTHGLLSDADPLAQPIHRPPSISHPLDTSRSAGAVGSRIGIGPPLQQQGPDLWNLSDPPNPPHTGSSNGISPPSLPDYVGACVRSGGSGITRMRSASPVLSVAPRSRNMLEALHHHQQQAGQAAQQQQQLQLQKQPSVCDPAGMNRVLYGAQRKGPNELSPIKQRTMQLQAASIKLAEYTLPPSQPGPMLNPALLSGLRPPPSGLASCNNTLGTLLIPSAHEGVRFLGGSTRLPFQHPGLPFSTWDGSRGIPAEQLAGAMETSHPPPYGGDTPYNFDVGDCLPYPSIQQPVSQWLGEGAAAAARGRHLRAVPADVKTGEDAVRLFSSSAAREGLLIYLNLAHMSPHPSAYPTGNTPPTAPPCLSKRPPSTQPYNPYDLRVVPKSRADPEHHFIMSQTGTTQMRHGTARELLPHHQWVREMSLFTLLRRLVFFRKHDLFWAFWRWRGGVKAARRRSRVALLEQELLQTHPVYGKALSNVRRTALAISEDPTHSWRKAGRGSGQGRRVDACRWVPPPEPPVPIRRGLPSAPTANTDARSHTVTDPTPRLPRASTPHADPSASATGGAGGGRAPSEATRGVLELDLEQGVAAPPGAPAAEAPPLAGLAYQLGHLALPTKWKHQSPALQKAAADFKRARLERCTTDRDRFLRFISLCDSLVLTQMCSLARAALALCLSELTQPRRVGLFLMVGCVDDAAAAAAAAAVARSAVATASAMSATQQHSAWMRQTGTHTGRHQDMSSHNSALAEATAMTHDSAPSRTPDAVAGVMCFRPAVGDVANTVGSLPRELLAVVLAACQTILTFPRVQHKALLHAQVRSCLNDIGAATNAWVDQAAAVRNISHHNTLRAVIDVPTLQEVLSASVAADYRSALSKPGMGPYMGHLLEFGLVAGFSAQDYTHCDHTPQRVHAEMLSLQRWVDDLSVSKPVTGTGLLQLDATALRATLLPAVYSASRGLLALLGSLLTRQAATLVAQLHTHSMALVQRPTGLPEFVLFMEAIAPHLETNSPTRAMVRTSHNSLIQLYDTFTLMNGKVSKRAGATAPGPVSMFHDGSSAEVVEGSPMPDSMGTPAEVRALRQVWGEMVMEVEKYQEECNAAVNYLELSLAHMIVHLTAALQKVDAELTAVLLRLRTGTSSDPRADPERVAQELEGLGATLQELQQEGGKLRGWSKTLARRRGRRSWCRWAIDTLASACHAVLASREALWKAIAGWSLLLDRVYNAPCTSSISAATTAELEAHIARLGREVEKISSTPACHTPSSFTTSSTHGANTSTPCSHSPCTGPPPLRLHDAYPIPTAHVDEDERRLEESASGTTLAQLLSRCTESPETRQLVTKAVAVAAEEHRIQLQLRSIQRAMASTQLAFSKGRTGGAHAILGLPEVLLLLQGWEAEVRAIAGSPYVGGVLGELEVTETLLAWVYGVFTAAHSCQRQWLFLCAILLQPAVATQVPHAADGLEAQGVLWRKAVRLSMQQSGLPAAAGVLQLSGALEAEFEKITSRVSPVLGTMRLHYPRLHFVSDRALLEGLALAGQPSELPRSLLQGVLTGLVGFEIRAVPSLPAEERPSTAGRDGGWTLGSETGGSEGEGGTGAEARCAGGVANSPWSRLLHKCDARTLHSHTNTLPLSDHHLLSPLHLDPARAAPLGTLQPIIAFSSESRIAPTRSAPPSHRAQAPSCSSTGDRLLPPNTGIQAPKPMDACAPPTAPRHPPPTHPPPPPPPARRATPRHPLRPTHPLPHHPHAGPHHGPPHPAPAHDRPLMVAAVRGASGERLQLLQAVDAGSGRPLEAWLRELERATQAGAAAATRRCMASCGVMQADDWVSSFPSISILLVDSVVFTQSAHAALTRLQAGQSIALRSLLDQTVLRLETIGRQLRGALLLPAVEDAHSPATASRNQDPLSTRAPQSAPPSRGSSPPAVHPAGHGGGKHGGQKSKGHAAQTPLPTETVTVGGGGGGLTVQGVRSLQKLIAIGVCHRQAVESLIAGEAEGPGSFEWLRQVRHAWDPETGALTVSFAQSAALRYGWEYDGNGLDCVTLTSPMSMDGLLASISALGSSPVVSLPMGCGLSNADDAMRGLTSLCGRYHATITCAADTSAAGMNRLVGAAVSIGCWVSIKGMDLLSLQVLSCVGQALHELVAAYHAAAPFLHINRHKITSPWLIQPAPSGPDSATANRSNAVLGPAARRTGSGSGAPPRHTSLGAPVHPWDATAFFVPVPLPAYLPCPQERPGFSAGESGDAPGGDKAPWAFLAEAAAAAAGQGGGGRGRRHHAELSETLRRLGRAVTLQPADPIIALEAGLRCMGLRDAGEAAHAVCTIYKLAAAQLHQPQQQYRLEPRAVRSILVFVKEQWMRASPPGSGGGGGGGGAAGSSPCAGPVRVQRGPVAGVGEVWPKPGGCETTGTHGGAAQGTAGSEGSEGGHGCVSHTPSPAAGSGAAGHTRVGASAVDGVEAALGMVLLAAAHEQDAGVLRRLVAQLQPLLNSRSTALALHVERLHTALSSARAVLLVGPPGAGKTLVWKALVAATHGPAALLFDDASHRSSVCHIFPELIPAPYDPWAAAEDGEETETLITLPGSGTDPDPGHHTRTPTQAATAEVGARRFTVADATSSSHVRRRRSARDQAHHHPHRWMAALLEGDGTHVQHSSQGGRPTLARSFELHGGSRACVEWPPLDGGVEAGEVQLRGCSGLDTNAGSGGGRGRDGQGGGGAVVGGQLGLSTHTAAGHSGKTAQSYPSWVVFDGPLGSSKADACMSLVLDPGGYKAGSNGVSSVALRPDCRAVWECCDVSRAAPAVMAALPLVYVGYGVMDEAALVGKAVLAALQTPCWRLVLCSPGQIPHSGVPLSHELAKLTALAPPASHGVQAPGTATALARRFSTMMVAVLTGAASALAQQQQQQQQQLSEAGAYPQVGLAGRLTALFAQASSELALPAQASGWRRSSLAAQLTPTVCTDESAAQMALGRAVIFTLFWSIAALVMSEASRATVEDVIRQQAEIAEMGGCLPPAQLGGVLLCPKDGVWLPWSDAVTGLMSHRRLIRPMAEGANYHFFPDAAGGGPDRMFVPDPVALCLQYVAALSIHAGLQPLLVGPHGSGRRTLLRHLLATGGVHPQWSHGSSAGSSDGPSPAGSDVFPASLEWLRQVLDTGCSTDLATGTRILGTCNGPELWKSHAALEAKALTNLKISLAGKMAPCDFDLLLDAARCRIADRSEKWRWLARRPLVRSALIARILALEETRRAGDARMDGGISSDTFSPESSMSEDESSEDVDDGTAGPSPVQAGSGSSVRTSSPPRGGHSGGGQGRGGEGGGAVATERSPEEQRAQLDSITSELMRGALFSWGYGDNVPGAAAQLGSGFFCGGHVLMVGADTQLLSHIGALAAISCGASLVRLGTDSGGTSIAKRDSAAMDRSRLLLAFTRALGASSCAAASKQLEEPIPAVLGVRGRARQGEGSLLPSVTSHHPIAPLDPKDLHVVVIPEHSAQDGTLLELLQQLLCCPSSLARLSADAQSSLGIAPQHSNFDEPGLRSARSAARKAAAADSRHRWASGQRTPPPVMSAREERSVADLMAVSAAGAPPDMLMGDSPSLRRNVAAVLLASQKQVPSTSHPEVSTHRSDASGTGPGARNWHARAAAWRQADDGLVFAQSQVQQVRRCVCWQACHPLGVLCRCLFTVVAETPPPGWVPHTLSKASAPAPERLAQAREAEGLRREAAATAAGGIARSLRVVLILSPARAAAVRARHPALAAALTLLTASSPTALEQQDGCIACVHQLAPPHHRRRHPGPPGACGPGQDTCPPTPPPDGYLGPQAIQRSAQHTGKSHPPGIGLGHTGTPPSALSAATTQGAGAPPASGVSPTQLPRALSHEVHPAAGEPPDAPTSASAERTIVTPLVAKQGSGGKGVGSVPLAVREGGADVTDAAGEGGTCPSDPGGVAAGGPAAGTEAVCGAGDHSRAGAGAVQAGGAAGSGVAAAAQQDMVEALSKIHSAHRKLMVAQRASLWVCLRKLTGGGGQLATCEQAILASHSATKRHDEALVTVGKKIVTLEAFISGVELELSVQDAAASEAEELIGDLQAGVDAEIAGAQTRYNAAIEEVGALSELELAELRTYHQPHERIKLVLMAVAVLFDWPSDWRSAQRLMNDKSPNLVDRVRLFSPRHTNAVAVSKLHRIVREPEFNIVLVGQVSKAAKSLCWWALCVSALLTAVKEADLKMSSLAEGRQRLANTVVHCRRLRGELAGAVNELGRQVLLREELEQSRHEATAQATDNELQVVADIEQHLPTLIGDATITAASVVYLGPFSSPQRASLQQAWVAALRAACVPVQPVYNFDKFMAMLGEWSGLDDAAIARCLPTWRENLLLMALSARPPLMYDPAGEARSLYGLPREPPLVERLAVRYRQAMRDTVRSPQLRPHRLYLRLLSGPTAAPLTHSLHTHFMPVRFTLQQDEVVLKLRHAVLEAVDFQGLVRLNMLQTQAYQQRMELLSLSCSISNTIAQTHGPIWRNPGLVDATCGKALRLAVLQQSVPKSEAEIAAIEVQLERWAGAIAAGSLIHGVLSYMSRSDRRAILPDQHFLRIFKAAVRKALQQEAAEAAALRERELAYQRLIQVKTAHAAAARIAAMRHHITHITPADPLKAQSQPTSDPAPEGGGGGGGGESSSDDGCANRTISLGSDPEPQSSSTYSASSVDLESSVLATMCSVVCCGLDHARAVVFRTLVALQQSARGGLITQPEADFALRTLREGPSKARPGKLLQPPGGGGAAAAAGTALGADASRLLRKALSTEDSPSGGSSLMDSFVSMMFDRTRHEDEDGVSAGGAGPAAAQQHSSDLVIQAANAAAGNWMHPPPGSVPSAHLRPAGAFLQSIAQSGAGQAQPPHLPPAGQPRAGHWPSPQRLSMVSRLEASYPDAPLVDGLTVSIQTHAARWHAHLSAPTPHPLILLEPARYMTRVSQPVLSEHTLVSVSSDAALLSAASKGPRSASARPPSVGTGAGAPRSPSTLGGLPEPWATRLRSHPALQLLLTSLVAPSSASGAAEALCDPILDPLTRDTPGEVLLRCIVAATAGSPLLVSTAGCEDLLMAIHQAKSLWAHGVLPLPPADGTPSILAARVVVHHLCAGVAGRRRALALLGPALEHGHWLVLMNAHLAPEALVEIQEHLNGSRYMAAADATTFRLFLAMPHSALPGLPASLLYQAVQIVLEPPVGIAAYVRGAMQLFLSVDTPSPVLNTLQPPGIPGGQRGGLLQP